MCRYLPKVSKSWEETRYLYVLKGFINRMKLLPISQFEVCNKLPISFISFFSFSYFLWMTFPNSQIPTGHRGFFKFFTLRKIISKYVSYFQTTFKTWLRCWVALRSLHMTLRCHRRCSVVVNLDSIQCGPHYRRLPSEDGWWVCIACGWLVVLVVLLLNAKR